MSYAPVARSEPPDQSWDNVRKRARLLEQDIDARLVLYSSTSGRAQEQHELDLQDLLKDVL